MIPLHHPVTGRTAKVRDAQVPALIDRGWEHVEPPEPPAQSASKPEWVDHAVSQGWGRGEAEGTTKADLADQL